MSGGVADAGCEGRVVTPHNSASAAAREAMDRGLTEFWRVFTAIVHSYECDRDTVKKTAISPGSDPESPVRHRRSSAPGERGRPRRVRAVRALARPETARVARASRRPA